MLDGFSLWEGKEGGRGFKGWLFRWAGVLVFKGEQVVTFTRVNTKNCVGVWGSWGLTEGVVVWSPLGAPGCLTEGVV